MGSEVAVRRASDGSGPAGRVFVSLVTCRDDCRLSVSNVPPCKDLL